MRALLFARSGAGDARVAESRSHARRRPATCKPAVPAICAWPNAWGPNSQPRKSCRTHQWPGIYGSQRPRATIAHEVASVGGLMTRLVARRILTIHVVQHEKLKI